ncbi:MAG: hypothetical protein WAU15_01170 [Nitrosomonas sp.]
MRCILFVYLAPGINLSGEKQLLGFTLPPSLIRVKLDWLNSRQNGKRIIHQLRKPGGVPGRASFSVPVAYAYPVTIHRLHKVRDTPQFK